MKTMIGMHLSLAADQSAFFCLTSDYYTDAELLERFLC